MTLKTVLKAASVSLFIFLTAITANAQTITVKGTVVDAADGSPLMGVAVASSAGGGTITDLDGKYLIQVPSDATLTFSCLSYKDVVEKVQGRSVIDVVMSEDAQLLEEVVVLGYTTQKKNELSSSVVTMSGEELTNITTPDVGNMLQGKAAGVLVLNASGQPGEGAQIRIRGTGSITAGADPLYVVDGVAGGSFNPNDVETITILKDASATALYGASAAGGVIVVTTKTAKDVTEVNFKASAGVKKALSGRFRPMNSEEFYSVLKKAYSATVLNALYPKELKKQSFDWMNESFRTGIVQDYYASVSGKSGKTSYFVSMDYYDEQGSLINTNFNRGSARINLSTPITDKITLAFRTAYNRTKEQGTSSYVTLESAYYMLPFDNAYDVNTGEPLYVDSGTRSDNGKNWYSGNRYNIFHNELYNYAIGRGESITADLQLTWNITDWLIFTTTNRYDSSNSFWEEYYDPRTNVPSWGNGRLYNSNSAWSGWGTTNLLKFIKQYGDHNISAIVGLEYGEGQTRVNTVTGTGMPAGQAAISACSSIVDNTGYGYQTRSWAWLAQAQWAYLGKYVVTASVRYDETSRFAPAARGGYFPGISGAWIISQEDFMSDVDALKFLKLRAGYGKTGNNNIEEFLYQDTYELSKTYGGNVAAVMVRQSNPNLGWEEAYMSSLGIETTLKNDINIGIDLYRTINTNLLLDVPVSPSTGFTAYTQNVGTISNMGVEFVLDAPIIKTKDLNWNAGFNVGMNQNRVVYLPNGDFLQKVSSGEAQQVKEGQDLYTWYMKKWAGVDPANGDPLWEVVGADGTITTTNVYADATMQTCGSASPKLSGGLNTSLTWKGFVFSATGSFIYGNKIFNSTRVSMDNDGSDATHNLMSIDNGLGWSRWEKAGDIATHPKIDLGGSGGKISSRFLEDGSFFRLRNVTLGYNLPKNLIEKINMKAAKVYVSADNIFTLTKFSGMDPEVQLEGSTWQLAGTYSMNYPVPFSVVAGIDIKF
ncbi:MAG: SusC/RagA family TonB-linked outer membrane protein [Bacteroidales bacterium]|nr:SusC/RagA family TonB-linked outer membrane protein [Bacteroidales bacterium]